MDYRKRDILELEIIDTAEGDACVAKLPEGMIVFVRGMSAPGDRVKASISKIKKNFLEARLEEARAARENIDLPERIPLEGSVEHA